MTGLREAALSHRIQRGVHRGERMILLLLRDKLDAGFDCFGYLRIVARRADADGAAARAVLDFLVPDEDLPGLDDELLGVAGVLAAAEGARTA